MCGLGPSSDEEAPSIEAVDDEEEDEEADDSGQGVNPPGHALRSDLRVYKVLGLEEGADI